MDNYISLVSGQSPSYAVQDDCSTTANMTNNNSGIITTGTVGTATDTDGTADASGTNTTPPNATGAATATTASSSSTAASMPRSANNGCVYPTDVADPVQPVQRRRCAVEGLRPGPRRRPARRVDELRHRQHPGGHRHRPRSRRRRLRLPRHLTADPVTNPTNLVAPSGDVSSFTGAQPANANGNGDPADQYVAKHFPTGWFTALTGESAGTQNGVTYPAQPALNQPATRSSTGPRTRRTRRPTQLRRQPHRQPRRPHLRPGARPHPPSQRGPGVQLDYAQQLQRRPRRHLPGQQPLRGLQPQRHAGLHPSRPPVLRSRGDDPGQLHRRALRLGPVPAVLHPAHRAVGGVQGRRADRHHLRRGQPSVHYRQQLQQRPGSRRHHHLSRARRPADLRGARDQGAGCRLPVRCLRHCSSDAAGENIKGHNVSTEPTGPNDPEVTNGSGDQLQPGPGAAGFIDRPTGFAGESPNSAVRRHGRASRPRRARLEHGHDPKINADDTGRLVSGTDAFGNTIPPDTFVGAVSDTGPLPLASNASATGASNNYAKPWTGSSSCSTTAASRSPCRRDSTAT